jgi:hypothetical protein
VKVAELLRSLFLPAERAPRPGAAPEGRPDIGPPTVRDDELRWARREAEAIIRRARALEIDVELERAVR